MAISNLVLTQQIYSEEPNGAHAHYREPVPLRSLISFPEAAMLLVSDGDREGTPGDEVERPTTSMADWQVMRMRWVNYDPFGQRFYLIPG